MLTQPVLLKPQGLEPAAEGEGEEVEERVEVEGGEETVGSRKRRRQGEKEEERGGEDCWGGEETVGEGEGEEEETVGVTDGERI